MTPSEIQTLEDAEKYLAKKEPKKFEYSVYDGDRTVPAYFLARSVCGFNVGDESQDIYDEILALIEWEYEVYCWGKMEKTLWSARYWAVSNFGFDRSVIEPLGFRGFETKLLAARAAFIAAVKQWGEGKNDN